MKRFEAPDLEWTERAACIGRWPLFSQTFYDRIHSGRREARKHAAAIAGARLVCLGCPVLVECREWALARPETFGMWGAMTPSERWHLTHRRWVSVVG